MSTPEKAGKSRKKNFPVAKFLSMQHKNLNFVKPVEYYIFCCI